MQCTDVIRAMSVRSELCHSIGMIAMQSFINLLRSAAQKLSDRLPKAQAELEAAIILQRRIIASWMTFDAKPMYDDVREIMQHNEELPQEMVLSAHQAMLVGARTSCACGQIIGVPEKASTSCKGFIMAA